VDNRVAVTIITGFLGSGKVWIEKLILETFEEAAGSIGKC